VCCVIIKYHLFRAHFFGIDFNLVFTFHILTARSVCEFPDDRPSNMTKQMTSPRKALPQYFVDFEQLFERHYPGQGLESVLRDSFDAVVELIRENLRPRVKPQEARRRLKAFYDFVCSERRSHDDGTETQGDVAQLEDLALPQDEVDNLPDLDASNFEIIGSGHADAYATPDAGDGTTGSVEPAGESMEPVEPVEPAGASMEPGVELAAGGSMEPADPDADIVQKCEVEITTVFAEMVEKLKKDFDLYASWHMVSRGLVGALETLMLRHHALIDDYNDKKKEYEAHSSGTFMTFEAFQAQDPAAEQVRNLIETYKLQGDFDGVEQMENQLESHLKRLPEKYEKEKKKFEDMKQQSLPKVAERFLQPVVPKQQQPQQQSGRKRKATVQTKKADEHCMIQEHLQKPGDWVPSWQNSNGDVSFSDYVNHVVAGHLVGDYGLDTLTMKDCDCQTCRIQDPSKNTRGTYFKSALHCPSYSFKSRVVLWSKSGGVYSGSVPDIHFYASRMQKNGPNCKIPQGCEFDAPQIKKKNLLHFYENRLYGSNLTGKEKEDKLNPRCHMALFANSTLSVLVLMPLEDVNKKAVEEMMQAGYSFKTTIMPVERLNKERLGKIVPNQYKGHRDIVTGSKHSLFVFDPRNRSIIAERIIMRGHHLRRDCSFNGSRMDTLEKLKKMKLSDLERLEETLLNHWTQPDGPEDDDDDGPEDDDDDEPPSDDDE